MTTPAIEHITDHVLAGIVRRIELYGGPRDAAGRAYVDELNRRAEHARQAIRATLPHPRIPADDDFDAWICSAAGIELYDQFVAVAESWITARAAKGDHAAVLVECDYGAAGATGYTRVRQRRGHKANVERQFARFIPFARDTDAALQYAHC